MESLFVQKSPEHLRELHTDSRTLGRSLYGVPSGNVPSPTDPTTAGSGWPSSLLPESPREALAPGQRRRLCGRWSFLTSTKSVRSDWDSGLESLTGWSCSDPPWRHSISWTGAFSTESEDFTGEDSPSFPCGRRS